MNEYLSKEYIRNVVQQHWDDSCGAECYAYDCVLYDIDEAPIADVVEVKHGYWIEKNDASYCSVCGEGITGRNLFICDGENWIPVARFNYCSSCGAKMDGVVK